MLEILNASLVWQRLVGIATEISLDVRRMAFSTQVRENGDYACGILDATGNLLAQAAFTQAIYANGMSTAARETVAQIGLDKISEGDVLITNDPWLVAGHLPDI